MKTSELIGPALDWAVSSCLTGGELFQSGRVAHKTILHCVGGEIAPYFMKDSGVIRCLFEPSASWAQGGPIIEREDISVNRTHNSYPDLGWIATKPGAPNNNSFYQTGAIPLIAAMRCFVAAKLGDEIEIPEELK